jgi:enoyl-CoA hydratase/carnithine racemase
MGKGAASGKRQKEASMQFEHFPGLVDAVHDGRLPTAQGWQDSLLVMDTVVATLNAEISQIDTRIAADPRAASQLCHKREGLEERLHVAMRKRETIESALAAGLVSDPVEAPESSNSAASAGVNQE